MSRICSTCQSDKPDYEFSKKQSVCKECNKQYQKQYRATPAGLATKWWSDMNRRAQNKDGKHPSYQNVRVLFERDAFIKWATTAIEVFQRDYPYEVPSLDRADPDGDYAFGNVRVIPWRENSRLARRKSARRYKANAGLVWHQGKRTGATPISWATDPPPFPPREHKNKTPYPKLENNKNNSVSVGNDFTQFPPN